MGAGKTGAGNQKITNDGEVTFIKKVIKSRNSFLLWIPKDEADYIGFKEGDFIQVKLKRLKKKG